MSTAGPDGPTDEPADAPRPGSASAPDGRPGTPDAAGASGGSSAAGASGSAGAAGTSGAADASDSAGAPGAAGAADADDPTDDEVDAAAWAAAARKREHAIRGTLAAALCLEALTVLFVPRAVARVGDDGLTGTRLTILVVIAALLFLAAGLVKSRAGLVLGSVLQVAVIATGVMVGAMYFLGLLFAGVWAYVLWVRQAILDAAERAGAPG